MMNRLQIGSLASLISLVAGVGLARQADATSPAGATMATESKSVTKVKKGGAVMKGFVKDIEGLAVKNDDFRRVLYTAKHCQLVVMALKPKEEIGAEVHKTIDQFFRVEEGTGEAVLDGVRTPIQAGFAVVVPAGTNHNIINTGSVPLKLYTLYSPPNHRDGVVHHTRADAEADNEHFEGKTTE
jgi:mannose-6-phosphate isomerase-like protein (cupin superfamily)